MKAAMLAAAGSLLITGCAKKSEDVMASYQSPARFEHLSCQDVSHEMERVSSSVAQLAGQQDEVRTRDQIAIGVGAVIFWPALFLLMTDDEEQELSRMKGEYEALNTVYAQKRCASSPVQAASLGAQPTAAYGALPDGTPPPYEGVSLTRYTDSDMRWFCAQSWRERVSPEGRTEYNPCHEPAKFRR